jgi:outer membrane protein assembly factor BamE (lipoprotein component of BamABCDE complex)
MHRDGPHLCFLFCFWQKETAMRDLQPFLRLVVVVLMGSIMTLSGCTYGAMQKLSLDEQAEFHTYRKVMTASQERAYLAKATAAERTAYLREIGLAQRFQGLDPLDRDAVQSGFPRVGMSAEALRFVWGDPHYTEGNARRSAHWYYLGSSLALGEYGNQYGKSGGSRVDVYLVSGKVMGWVDGPKPDDEKGENFR